MTKTPKKAAKPDIELNRWCVEQAIRWPVYSHGGFGGYGQAHGQYIPPTRGDEDVIGRAKKIRDWITSATS